MAQNTIHLSLKCVMTNMQTKYVFLYFFAQPYILIYVTYILFV